MVHVLGIIITFLTLKITNMKSFKITAILFSAFVLFGLTSCDSGSGKKQPADTHVHDDGSVHEDHGEEHKTPVQENFKVDADSTIQQVEDNHDHDHGHDHSDPNHKH